MINKLKVSIVVLKLIMLMCFFGAIWGGSYYLIFLKIIATLCLFVIWIDRYIKYLKKCDKKQRKQNKKLKQ